MSVSAQDLRTFKSLESASGEALDGLAALMQEKVFAPGELIAREGDESSTLFLVMSGLVRVDRLVDRAEGRSKTVARIAGGEFFGEMSFFSRQKYSASVTAETESRVFLLPKGALEPLVRTDPKLAMEQVLALFSGVCGRLRHTTRELLCVVEIARTIGKVATLEELARETIGRLRVALSEDVSIALYKWNPFNDEYFLMAAQGDDKDSFEPVIDPAASPEPGALFARIDLTESREGLLVLRATDAQAFGLEDRQLVDTVAHVLAPAMVSARLREEEIARQLYEKRRQTEYGS